MLQKFGLISPNRVGHRPWTLHSAKSVEELSFERDLVGSVTDMSTLVTPPSLGPVQACGVGPVKSEDVDVELCVFMF